MRYTPLQLKLYIMDHLAGRFKGRAVFPKYNYFREELPMTLKNSVSGRNERVDGSMCLHELTMLLACLKKADFDDTQCGDAHTTYMRCYESKVAEQGKLREQLKQGLLGVRGTRGATSAQLNKLMAMWPQPGVQTKKHNRRRMPFQSYSDPNFLERDDRYLP